MEDETCRKTNYARKAIYLIGFLTFTVRNTQALKDMSNTISDQRYVDFLYKHGTRSGVRIFIKVINLLHRHEKLAAILRRIQALDVPPMWSVDVQVVVADEVKNNHGFKQWVTTDTHGCSASVTKYWQRSIKQGEVGCFVSHMKALQSVQLDSNQYLLILEDDADFYSDLLYRIDHCLQEDHEWDCIDFGGISMDGRCKKVTPYLYERQHVYQTHCILYNRKAVQKLANIEYASRIIPFDEFLPAVRGVHPRPDISQLFADVPQLHMYFPYERMATQIAGVHDTEGGDVLKNEFERVGDDADMLNYYMFKDANTDQSEIRRKVQEGNNNMWKFQLSGVQKVHIEPSDNWNLCVNRRNKVMCVCLRNNSYLQFQHSMQMITGPKTIVFPAYLSFKCQGQFDCFSGYGSSFF